MILKNKIRVKTKSSGTEYLLAVLVNVKGKSYVKSTGLKIPKNCWLNGKVVNKGSFSQAAEFNKELQIAKEKLAEIRDAHLQRYGDINKPALDWDWVNYRKFNGKINTITYNIDRVIRGFLDEGRKVRSVNSYKQVAQRISRFEETLSEPTNIFDIDLTWMKKFHGFLVKENYNSNTIHKTIKNLKTIFRVLRNDGFDLRSMILDYECPSKTYLPPKPIINADEFQRILKLEVDSTLEPYRRLFLLCLCTGLRFSDGERISIRNISDEVIEGKKEKFLNIVSIKTGKAIKHNITDIPIVEHIVRQSSFLGNYWHISNTKYNKGLKEICRMAGITQIFTTYKIVGGDQVPITVPKYKLVTAHTARHSFITNLYINGLDWKDIKYLVGISSDSVLNTYIHLSENQYLNRKQNASISSNPYPDYAWGEEIRKIS